KTRRLAFTAALLLLLLTGYLTKRVHALLVGQDDLFRKTAQLASVFTHSSNGIVITDSAMEIVAVNPAFETVSGFRKGEVLGRRAVTLVRTLADERFRAQLL